MQHTVNQRTPEAHGDASSAQNENDTSQDTTDTPEVSEEAQTTEDSAESLLDCMPCPQANDYFDDPDFKYIYTLISADKFEGSDTDLHRLLLSRDQLPYL